jgi:redox-sensing transcriptional repressor
MTKIPPKTVERLIVYRRLLAAAAQAGAESLYSHELASLAHVTPAQVRRDLMVVGYSGNPRRGYAVKELAENIKELLEAPGGQRAVLVGVGNLGRALLSYFAGRSASITVVAAFDNDPAKAGRVISGCRVFDVRDLGRRARESDASVCIIAVPGSQAQSVVDALVESRVTGILNFAPVPLRVRRDVYVEQVDIMRSFEKVAHFAKHRKVKEV